MDRVTWSLPGIELLALNWSLIGWIESKVITSVIDVVGENHMTTDSMSIEQAISFPKPRISDMFSNMVCFCTNTGCKKIITSTSHLAT